ncbi:MAG TPA: Ig-like domain-containing protein [Polyangiaceae bacterium]|nr:Ig-like domain-containing protein [Polyangiaceae bacterium]
MRTFSPRALGVAAIFLGAAAFPACGADDRKPTEKPSGGADASTDSGGGACPAGTKLLATDCDPIGGYCGLPFPSNVYLSDDPSGKHPSGKVVTFGATTLPAVLSTGAHVDPALFSGFDGFSPASAAMVYLPGATADGLPTTDTLAASVDPSTPTILLDVEKGTLVPHFVDLDQHAATDDQRALMLHPAVLLRNGARYVVAFRGVKDASGNPVPPPDAFRALRDGEDYPDASVDARRCLYADIFARLAAAGVKKDDLQVAWDFSVGSKESITNPLVRVRDAALATVGADGPEYTIKEDQGVQQITENPNPYIMRRIVLTMKAPLYLTTAAYTPGDPVPHLQWDDAGQPVQNGTMDVDVLVQIPNSVKTAGKHGLLQNGHGLFGSKSEGQNGYAATMCDGYHWIELATDLFGFASDSGDPLMAVEGLQGRAEVLPGLIDRQIQGHVNQLLAMRLMMGKVARDGIADAAGTVVLDPAWVDASVRAYRGDSQGGIMGGTYMAVSTDVTRGLLGEPGTPYSVLLNRSTDADLYNQFLEGAFGDGRAVQMLWGLIQLFWDRSEPSGFVPFLTENTLPNTPSHHVLMHDALGDHQVTTVGAHIMARAVGAKLVESNDAAKPVIREVFGLDRKAPPFSGESALVEYDFALPAEPLTNLPQAGGCDPHDRVRVLGPSQSQADVFLRTGEVEWKCDGVCNCDGANEEQNCAQSYKDQCCDAGSTDPKCQ